MEKILNSKKIILTAKIILLAICFYGVSGNIAYAQASYKLNSAKEQLIKVSGQSNVHGWTMTTKNAVCEAVFGALDAESNTPRSLSSLTFTVAAKSLKSEHESMDGRTYKTLKAENYPQIIFKLTEANMTAVSKNKFSVRATGGLTIAGVTKNISIQVNGEVNADNTITCTGQEKIKLTDYNIQPPSFMLGAMKVADDLTISFVLNFKK